MKIFIPRLVRMLRKIIDFIRGFSSTLIDSKSTSALRRKSTNLTAKKAIKLNANIWKVIIEPNAIETLSVVYINNGKMKNLIFKENYIILKIYFWASVNRAARITAVFFHNHVSLIVRAANQFYKWLT